MNRGDHGFAFCKRAAGYVQIAQTARAFAAVIASKSRTALVLAKQAPDFTLPSIMSEPGGLKRLLEPFNPWATP